VRCLGPREAPREARPQVRTAATRRTPQRQSIPSPATSVAAGTAPGCLATEMRTDWLERTTGIARPSSSSRYASCLSSHRERCQDILGLGATPQRVIEMLHPEIRRCCHRVEGNNRGAAPARAYCISFLTRRHHTPESPATPKTSCSHRIRRLRLGSECRAGAGDVGPSLSGTRQTGGRSQRDREANVRAPASFRFNLRGQTRTVGACMSSS